MKKEQVIHGLCSLLSIARIAQERNVLQSAVSLDIDREDKGTVDLHKKYYNEFLDVLIQL